MFRFLAWFDVTIFVPSVACAVYCHIMLESAAILTIVLVVFSLPSLSLSPPLCLTIYISTYLSTYLFICLSIHLSIDRSIFVSIYIIHPHSLPGLSAHCAAQPLPPRQPRLDRRVAAHLYRFHFDLFGAEHVVPGLGVRRLSPV